MEIWYFLSYEVLFFLDNKFQQKYNSYKFIMIAKQHPPASKTRLSPLFLLSKVKKNNQINNQRQSVLAIIQRQQTKISNRYGDIGNRFPVKTEGNQVSNKQKQFDQKLQNEETNSTSNKISQILKKSFNRGRFHSMERRRNRDASPYLSQQRKSYKDDSNKNISLSNSTNNAETVLKKSKSKQKILDNKNILQLQAPKRKVNKEGGERKKIFIHFDNFYRIDEIVEKKRVEKQIIVCVKKYILEEEGDSSEIEHLYSDDKTKQEVKHILFLEKLLVILIVDLVINRKMRLAEMFVKLAIKTVMKFYQVVFSDLKRQHLIEPAFISLVSPEAFEILQAQDQEKPNVTFNYIVLCLQAKLKTLFKYCKQIQKFYKKHQKNMFQISTNMSYFKLLQFYSQHLLGTNWSTWNIDFLQVCPSPYLHHDSPKKYTLVLDLDETLIHYKVGNSSNNYQGEFLIRPYMFEFLQQMSQYYELGIFTCSMPQYADLVINHMKPIEFRLYRHHVIKLQGEYVKDLSRLGRNLKNLILVDNLEQNFKLQRLNGIHIRSWYGDRNDDLLKKLGAELKKLALSNPQDLRLAQFQRKFL